jgi:hypothetical protein
LERLLVHYQNQVLTTPPPGVAPVPNGALATR